MGVRARGLSSKGTVSAVPSRFGGNLNHKITEPAHVKTNKMTFVPSEDSCQPGHLPSLIKSLRYPHEETLDP